jgi:hypothetical protein
LFSSLCIFKSLQTCLSPKLGLGLRPSLGLFKSLKTCLSPKLGLCLCPSLLICKIGLRPLCRILVTGLPHLSRCTRLLFKYIASQFSALKNIPGTAKSTCLCR